MAILEGCCCLSTVRQGSYVCAAYTLIIDMLGLILLPMLIDAERDYYSGNDSKPKSTSFLEPNSISPATMVFNIAILWCNCVTFITSLLLIYGLQKDSRIYLVPWIITMTVQTIVDIMHTVYLVATAIMEGTISPAASIIYTLDFFILSANIYALLCVISQYQEYMAGRGTSDYMSCRGRVKYTSHPTGISYLSTKRPPTYHETTASPTGNHTALIPSAIIPDDFSSPIHRPVRKNSLKHVQFGAFDDAKKLVVSNKLGSSKGECNNADHRKCLGVVAEEPSWVTGETTSATPLCSSDNQEGKL